MIKGVCSCGADCDFAALGDCEGYVKPAGVTKHSKIGDGWVHCCKAHLEYAKQNAVIVSWADGWDWDKPGPV